MNVGRRLVTAGGLFLSLLILGSLGYKLLEGWDWLDSVYMTLITLSTVGYGEVHPLSASGKIFTSGLIVVGVGAAFYALSTVVIVAVEGELASVLGGRRMRSKISNLRGHYIICGYGRVGQEIAREFKAQLAQFVIVDMNEEALQHARRRGYLVYEGDATLDDILIDAGVRRARCLVAASDSDAVNTYITLTAKALNPSLFLVARVSIPENAQKVIHAGADRVVSPYALAGQHIAQSAIRSTAGLDIGDSRSDQNGAVLAEIALAEGSLLEGRNLVTMFRDCATVTVLAILRPSGQVTVKPPPEETVRAGDVVIALGGASELESVNEAAQGPSLRQTAPAI